MPSSLRQPSAPADGRRAAARQRRPVAIPHARSTDRSARGFARALVVPLTIAAVGWGAMAFGAVYPWAYVPLAIACGAAGAAAFRTCRPGSLAIWPMAALACVAVAILAQEVPLPRAMLQRVSPAAHEVLAEYDLGYAAVGQNSSTPSAGRHPLSLAPSSTWTSLALLAGFGVFLFGLSASLNGSKATRIARALVVIGMVATLVALVQRATGTTRIYGFWQPEEAGAQPFGPFVNRNHFAGWILMAWPVGLGYFIGRLTESTTELRRRQRPVFAWFSTPLGGELVLLGFALIVLTLGGLLSMSRAGMLCLAVGMALFGAVAIRKLDTGWRRAVVILYLVAMASGAVGVIGVDGLATRLQEFSRDGLGDRTAVWADGWRVARAYPIAGTGINSFGTAMLFYQRGRTDVHFDEAHNDYLQLVVEGGALVVLPALLLAGLTVRDIRRRFREGRDTVTVRWTRIGAAIGLVMIALQELGDFSLQMPGNAALFCVVAAIALHSSK